MADFAAQYMKAWGKSQHTKVRIGNPFVFLVNIISYSNERDIKTFYVYYEFC